MGIEVVGLAGKSEAVRRAAAPARQRPQGGFRGEAHTIPEHGLVVPRALNGKEARKHRGAQTPRQRGWRRLGASHCSTTSAMPAARPPSRYQRAPVAPCPSRQIALAAAAAATATRML